MRIQNRTFRAVFYYNYFSLLLALVLFSCTDEKRVPCDLKLEYVKHAPPISSFLKSNACLVTLEGNETRLPKKLQERTFTEAFMATRSDVSAKDVLATIDALAKGNVSTVHFLVRDDHERLCAFEYRLWFPLRGEEPFAAGIGGGYFFTETNETPGRTFHIEDNAYLHFVGIEISEEGTLIDGEPFMNGERMTTLVSLKPIVFVLKPKGHVRWSKVLLVIDKIVAIRGHYALCKE